VTCLKEECNYETSHIQDIEKVKTKRFGVESFWCRRFSL